MRGKLGGAVALMASCLVPATAWAIGGSTDLSGLAGLVALFLIMPILDAILIQIGLGLLVLRSEERSPLWLLLVASPAIAWLVGKLPLVSSFALLAFAAPLPFALVRAKRPRLAILTVLLFIGLTVGGVKLSMWMAHYSMVLAFAFHAGAALPLSIVLARKKHLLAAIALPFAYVATTAFVFLVLMR